MCPAENPEPEIAEDGSGRPTAGLILVQPQKSSYWPLVRNALRGCVDHVNALYGKANSDMIAAADRGPFSHSVLYAGDVAVDSRSGGRPDAIARSSVPQLLTGGRALSFYRFEHPDGAPAPGEPPRGDPARAVQRVLDFLAPPASVDGTPLPDETNLFPVAAMVNLGLILVSSQRLGLRWLARILTRQAIDAEGMYCAELVAKAMEAAGASFDVVVDASRLPPPGSVDERVLYEALQQRLEIWNSVPIGDQGTAPPETEYPIERLRSLRQGLASGPGLATSTPAIRRVGFGEGMFPPCLVSPNDLARSPSFHWSGNHPGAPTGGDAEPVLERRASLVRVLALGTVVYGTRRYLQWRKKPCTTPPGPAVGDADGQG